MSTVINIRGTNGSGKSTVVRRYMEQFGKPTRTLGLNGKPVGYQFGPECNPVFVLGNYETDCGGLDASFSYPAAADDVCQFIQDLAKHGDVLCEGVIAMSSYGITRLTGLAASLKSQDHHIIFALLDTPENVCVERVKARRAAKGNLKPFNPANLQSKYKGIHKDQEKLRAAGLHCLLVPSDFLLGYLLADRRAG